VHLESSHHLASTLFSGIQRDEIKRLACRIHQASSRGFAKVELLRSMLTDLMFAGKRYYVTEDVKIYSTLRRQTSLKRDHEKYSDLGVGGLTNLADVFHFL